MYGADTLGVRTDDLSATSDRQCGVGGGCSDTAMPPLPFGARVLTDSSGHWPPVGHGPVEALDLAGWFAGGTGESASAWWGLVVDVTGLTMQASSDTVCW